LILVDEQGYLRTRDVQTGKDIDRREGHHHKVTGLAFAADGQTLVSFGADGALCCWDTRSGRQRSCMDVPKELAGGSLSVSASGKWAALMGRARAVVGVIDVPGSRVAWRLPPLHLPEFAQGISDGYPPAREFPPCLVAPDGSAVFVPRTPHRAEVRTAPTGSLKEAEAFAVDDSNSLLAFDGRWKLQAADWLTSFEMELVEGATGKLAHHFVDKKDKEEEMPFEPVMRGGFSPDSRLVGGANGTHAFVWERASGRLLAKAPLPAHFHPDRLVIAANGRMVIAGPVGKGKRNEEQLLPWIVWDLQSQRTWRTTPPANSMVPAALSFDGRTLALAAEPASILLYDVPLPAPRKAPPARAEEIVRLWAALAAMDARTAWQARQRLIASGSLTVAFLQKHLAPAPQTVSARLLANLGSDDYEARNGAMRKLAESLKRGDHNVEQALRELMQRKPALETYLRAERLVRTHAARPLKYTAEQLRQVRAVAVLEMIGSKEAVALLRRVAGGSPAVLTQEARDALDRLDSGVGGPPLAPDR
jgi:hypothetical protein